jgi:hypothetical protein
MSRRLRMLVAASGVAVVAVGAVGLGQAGVHSRPNVRTSSRVRLIAAPRHSTYDSPVLWADTGKVIVNLSTGVKAGETHLAAVDLASGSVKRLPLFNDPGCPYQTTAEPDMLADGQLAYLHECFGNAARVPGQVVSLMAYQPRTGANVRLRPYFLPPFGIYYDFSRGGTGVANDRDGLSERLAWLGAKRLRYLALPFARAGFPEWSPNGREFVVDAVPATAGAGVGGLARLDLPRRLYVLNKRGHITRVIGNSLRETGPAAWSSDGQWLALSMWPSGQPQGLWLVRVSDGKLILLLRGRQFGGAAWLPGNRQLLVAVGVNTLVPYAIKDYGRSDVGLYVVTVPKL